MRLMWSILLALLFVPNWTGEARLPLIGRDARITVAGFVPPGGWPRRIGALRPIGAVTLDSDDPASGSWSALAIRGGRITLLGDGGNYVRFALRKGRAIDTAAGFLRDGPMTGWSKRDRDGESLALDPASGTAWVGYERANAVWRYSPDLARAEARSQPAEMRDWTQNGGAESLVRLADNRFLAISEQSPGKGLRDLLLFVGDPTDPRARPVRITYRPPPRYSPSDAAQLPNGDILVLNRRHRLPLRFAAKLVRIPRAALRPGTITGHEIATLEPPVLTENAEGVAVTVERGQTMIWIVTDNDSMRWRRSYLYKFALPEEPFIYRNYGAVPGEGRGLVGGDSNQAQPAATTASPAGPRLSPGTASALYRPGSSKP